MYRRTFSPLLTSLCPYAFLLSTFLSHSESAGVFVFCTLRAMSLVFFLASEAVREMALCIISYVMAIDTFSRLVKCAAHRLGVSLSQKNLFINQDSVQCFYLYSGTQIVKYLGQ
jgi:hypothetical protein